VKLTIEPTQEFFMDGEVMVRMWQGTATHDDGSQEPVVALVACVAFTGQAAAAAEGLVSIPSPYPEEAKRWAERVLNGR
jgi:hypothetical protein